MLGSGGKGRGEEQRILGEPSCRENLDVGFIQSRVWELFSNLMMF